MTKTVRQRIRYVWVRVGVLLLVASPAAMYLMFRAQNLPPETFATTSTVMVTESDNYVRFQPAGQTRSGLMLVPGCPADPHAYAPLARAVALKGVLAVIVKVPLRCAPWATHRDTLRQRIVGVIDSCFDCAWTLAGHSRGARHALEVARALPAGRLAALVLMGTTHPRDESFANLSMPVVKILASEDGVAPLDAARANSHLLPAGSRSEVIEGGNHAQFAYYGYQVWDHEARITREQQHERLTALLLDVVTGPSRP